MRITKRLRKGANALAALAAGLMLFGAAACSHDSGGSGDRNEGGNEGPAYGTPDASAPTDLSDNIIRLKFTSKPTLIDDGSVEIFDGTTKIDTIKAKGEKYVSVNNSKGAFGEINVDDQLIVLEEQTDGSYDLIIVTHTDANGYSKLTSSTEYTVKLDGLISGETDKTFTTKARASIEGTTINVGPSGDFVTIQGAFNYLRAKGATGDWTITVAEGKYHERLGYSGSANITIEGPEDDNYGSKAYVYWRNNQNMGNNGQRARASFVFYGGDLTIKNMSFENTTSRKVEGDVPVQAETLNFDVPNKLVVYNSSFYSYQDTLILGNSGGKAWFYKSKIAGDVDFIWGTLDAGLFEDCVIVCRNDGMKGNAEIFASRTAQSGDTIGKGYVLYNSEIQIEERCDAYYGRSSGGGDWQAAVLGCTVTDGKINSKLWNSKMDKATVYDPAGDAAVAFKSYNNKNEDGSVISTAEKLPGTEDLSERVANREYNGRWVILNRVFNIKTKAYENSKSIWDINAVAAAYDAPADDSVNNIFVDPVYVKNLVSTGSGVQLTVTAATATGLTYSFATDADTFATVDKSGKVTPVRDADGVTTVTVTASNGRKDTAQIQVIPVGFAVEKMEITSAPETLHLYQLADVTAAFVPDFATNTEVEWKATGNIKIVDVDGKNTVDTITTNSESPSVTIMATGTGEGTITAKSTDTDAVAGTAEITVDGVVYYNAWDGYVLQNKNLYGILNFQSGKGGIWHDIVVEGRESGSKIQPGSADRVQTRGVNLYIPVDGSKTIDIVCQLAGADFKDGDGGSPTVTEGPESEGDYRYHYTFNYNAAADSAKTVSGANLKEDFEKWAIDTSRSLADATPDDKKTYFKIEVGTTDRYWAYITVTDYEPPAGGTLSVASFETTNVELDLNGTTSYKQTTTATLTGADGTPTITYSSSNEDTITVNATTGEVTAVGMGEAEVTATASFGDLIPVTKSYKVTVKDTGDTEDAYEIDLTKVHGSAGDYGKFSVVSGYDHNQGHGWAFNNGNTLSVKVNGSSKVSLGGCQYSNGAMPTVKVGEVPLTTTATTTQVGSGCKDMVTWTYAGTEAGTVTFTFGGGTTYVHSVKVEKY